MSIGKPLSRIEGSDKVTGRARYAGDVVLPGMLHARDRWCTRRRRSRARIHRQQAALAQPGVVRS